MDREPDATEQTAIVAAASTGTDADLPARDRRSRPDPLVDARGAALVAGDVVRVGRGDIGRARVIGHARGRGWILLAWVEGTVRSFGTVPVAEVRLP